MSRNADKNALVREERRQQILDAALSVYVRCGYHGADMDAVADEAGLAKGLIYYYFKTKKELFAALCTWMFDEGFRFSNDLLKDAEGLMPVEQLAAYIYGFFGASKANPRMAMFYMRVPFDAYAIFNPEQWTQGAAQSDIHRRSLAVIIERGVSQGVIPPTDPSRAANSFWSVFVANLFEYSRLMVGAQQQPADGADALREVARFCFQGLGVDNALWHACLEKAAAQKRTEAPRNEAVQKR